MKTLETFLEKEDPFVTSSTPSWLNLKYCLYHLALLCQTNIFQLHTCDRIWHYIKQNKYGTLGEWFLLIVNFEPKYSFHHVIKNLAHVQFTNLEVSRETYWFTKNTDLNVHNFQTYLQMDRSFLSTYTPVLLLKIIKIQMFKLFQINVLANSLTTNLVRQCFVGKNMVNEISSALYIMQNSSSPSPCYIYIRGTVHSRNIKSCVFVSKLHIKGKPLSKENVVFSFPFFAFGYLVLWANFATIQ